jgi:hypothetical protein
VKRIAGDWRGMEGIALEREGQQLEGIKDGVAPCGIFSRDVKNNCDCIQTSPWLNQTIYATSSTEGAFNAINGAEC